MSGPADPGPASTDPANAESAEPAEPSGAAETANPDGTVDPDGTADSTGTGPQRRRRWRRGLTEMVAMLLAAALLAVLLRAYVCEVFWIPSASMVPTLSDNDRILVQKAFYSWPDVREGDIVVFTHPPLDHCPGDPNGDLVKRVIALPGQTIYSVGSSIYVNGHLLAEPYLPAYDPLGPPIASSQHPFRVPPGEFFVLGDNRSDSCDSRFWGPIQGSSIIGKAILVIWHNNHPELHGL